MSQPLNRKRNLDILKLICAFGAVCIHVPFPGLLGTVVMTLARLAVPVFFMITGFFYRTVKENGREKQQLIKVLKLTVFANVLYFAWGLLFSFVSASSVGYISQVLNINSMLRLLFLNESPFEIHLWYLSALLYALLILQFLTKREKLIRASYCLIPLLLLGNLLIGKYATLLFGMEVDLPFSRNFLFVGLPYILLGILLSENIDCIKNIFADRRRLLVLLSVFLCVASVWESRILNTVKADNAGDNYISTPLLACAVLILAVVTPDVKENNLLAKIGKATSTGIYIFHLIIKDVLAILLTGLFGSIYLWARPICVFAASIVLALVLNWAMGWLKRKNQEKQPC